MRKIFNLKLFRRDFAIKQQELAAILSCSQSHISSLERGERDILPLEEKTLADKYGRETLDKYLLIVEPNKEPNGATNYDALIESMTNTIESQQETIKQQQQTITHLLNIIEKSND